MLKATLVNQRLLMKTKKPCYNIATGRMTVVPPEFSVHHSGETPAYLTQIRIESIFVWYVAHLTMDKALIDYVTCNTGTLTHITGMQNITHIHSMNLPFICKSSHNIIWRFGCELLFSLSYFSVPAPGLPSCISTGRFSPAPSSLQVFLQYSSRSRPFSIKIVLF